MDIEIENSPNNSIYENSTNFSNMLRLSLEKKFFSIDRFEENFAVCENLDTGEFINIEKDLLPSDAKEGTILKFENNSYLIDFEKTASKKAEIKNLVDSLFENN